MERERGASAALWGHAHLPLLARAGSKESVEYILQALWRTRRTGLDAADRTVARDALQLSSDAELDPVSTPISSFSSLLPSFLPAPSLASRAGGRCRSRPLSTQLVLQLLVCLRILIRRCVNEDFAKDDIPKLFPEEVPPELQKLLTLLLQKFQPEWQADAAKDQEAALHSSAAECQSNQNGDTSEHRDAANAELQNGAAPVKGSLESGQKEVKKSPLAKDSLDKMLKDLFSTRDQMATDGRNTGHELTMG
ncbi:uncharacterized protein LOC100192695 [Zea mays]|uniref:Uncharacterized protein n=1 Tax=Zea mays TaxID=4577 RepID=B4FCB2_MAIZE|nr:uncharacterized protein LOC100192695 [Zea mays]ACF79755.1 unknown [Zea mays]ONM03216.1 hypothetical protein ZEAMMB73_Zm00001d031618 [Zea mays]|eukprot:NP_001131370.1 uncharacterized protein LOC100192695 [Zea mays]